MLGPAGLLLALALAAPPPARRIEFPFTLLAGVRYGLAWPDSHSHNYRWDIHTKLIVAKARRGGLGVELGYQKFPRGRGFYVITLAEICVLRCR